MMLRCGLLGERLSHSYSPQIHAALCGYQYKLYEVPEEKVGEFLRNGSFDGLNVTIPYKQTVIPYLDELSDTAEKIGSVNTIVRRKDGTLFGDNTDIYGLKYLLKKHEIPVENTKVLVLGSGGTSRTACFALEELGAKEVVVVSRNGEMCIRDRRRADRRSGKGCKGGRSPCPSRRCVQTEDFPLRFPGPS